MIMSFKQLIFIGFLAGILIFPACEDFVQSVDDPINVVSSEALQTEDQVPFFMDGVKGRYHITHDALTVIAGGLSDALEFDSENVSDATFPTFEDIDIGEINFDNNSVDGPFNDLGQARFLADDFLNSISEIEFSDSDLQQEAQFTGNLYGGLARYTYAAYFGLEPENGGGVIDEGPFIPSAEMYSQAIDKFDTALNFAATGYDTRLVNSLIGRIHVYQGNYGTAETFLNSGLGTTGEVDPPFQSVHSLESQNAFAAQAGASRNQYTVASRFADYIDDDADEANRIPIEELPEGEYSDAGLESGLTIYRQTKYSEGTNINIISWQENHLLRAEVEFRENGAAGATAARTLINEVRASHEIDPIPATTPIDLDLILEERDKELFLTGHRMIDQRRTDNWHLPEGTWKYFPITQSERNQNENL